MPQKIHTGTKMEKFGDGYFSVFNPQDETRKLRVTTSNNSTVHRNSITFTAIVGQFQCISVEQILNEETQKLDHKIKFNGNTILSREYDLQKKYLLVSSKSGFQIISTTLHINTKCGNLFMKP